MVFTLGPQYLPNHNPGLVAMSSVRVGKGTFASTATWQPACHTGAQDGIWDSNVTRAEYAGALAQECAPNARMCHNPGTITQQAAVFWVPLGESFFDAVAPDPPITD